MLIRARILGALAVPALISVGAAAAPQAPEAADLKPGDFVTFILPEAGDHPEPRDPQVKLGVGGSAVEQPTDVLVYVPGKAMPFAGQQVPGLCAPGTAQTAELVDPEGKRPRRTLTVITTHPNVEIPPQTRLEEIRIFSKCLDADDKLYIEYMGTLRSLPGEAALESGAR
jgi:hypothetical protein